MRRRGSAAIALVSALAVAVAGTVRCSQGDVRTPERAETARPRSTSQEQRPIGARAAAGDAESLIQALGCGGCHTGVPVPRGPIARPLGVRDRALDLASTFAYLRDSPRAGTPKEAHIPSFHLSDAEALALSLHLAGGPDGGGRARRRFDSARGAHRAVEAEDGARIFRALNCAACHVQEGAEPRKNGPPLAGVASRLRPAALRDFLRHPYAVRPFGFEPGSGGRMPDFVLNDAEVDSVVAYFGKVHIEFGFFETDGPGVLSAFSAAKARALLERKLSCLGCHALDGVGGRIGPDLGRAGERLEPEYLAAIITDPQRTMPGTVMPRAMLPPATRDLIIAFLASGGAAGSGDEAGGARDASGDELEPDRSGYLSLIDHDITYPPALDAGMADEASEVVIDKGASHARPAALAAPPHPDPLPPRGERGTETRSSRPPPAGGRSSSLYAARCAMCHGAEGRGDGYNARYLRASPAVHASADSMSRRPDDTLFDGIHAGGAILGGSPEMPAFAESLTARQIAGLVAYIRQLCNCRGPAWAEGR